MEMPTVDTPPSAYLSKSAYTIARVAAAPKAAGLEKGVTQVHVKLKQALRDLEDHEEQEQKDIAVLDSCDSTCDDDVEGYELGLLGAVKKNRAHPRYLRYFKEGLREVTQAEPRKVEPALVGQMLEAMAEDQNDPEIGGVIATFQPQLAASRQAVLEADKALVITEKAIAYLEDMTLPALMAAWQEEYKKLEGALITVFASDHRRVDRFFKPFRNRSKPKKKAAAPTPPAPATPPSPT
jgi:hypothetical protein